MMTTVEEELLVEDAEEEVGPKVQARACARTDALRVGEQHQHHESRARAKAAAADADVKVLSRLAHESLQLAAAHALELASSASSRGCALFATRCNLRTEEISAIRF